MERITLNAEFRDKAGKGAARSLRRADGIPAVIYKRGESRSIKLDRKELAGLIKSTSAERVIVNLKFPDGGSRLALIKDYQFDPVGGDLLHTDFLEVSLTEKVKVGVRLSLKGEPIGVKRDGGILQYGVRNIEVECLPDSIPGHMEVDVSELLTGHAVHVSDLKAPEGVKILTELDKLVATVTAPVVEKAPAAPTEEEAAAAAAAQAAAPAEAAQPEVIKKGKEKEGKEKEEKEKS